MQALAVIPYQAPSTPIEELCLPGQYQTRQAVLPFGVLVVYREDYLTETVDLLMVCPADEPRPDH